MIVLALELVPFEGIAFLWFLGVVRDRIGQREDRFFATVFLGSGLLFVALLFVASAVTAAFLAEIAARIGSPKEVSGVRPQDRRGDLAHLRDADGRGLHHLDGHDRPSYPLHPELARALWLHDRRRPASRGRHHTMGRADIPCLDTALQSRHPHQESRGRASRATGSGRSGASPMMPSGVLGRLDHRAETPGSRCMSQSSTDVSRDVD